MIQFNLLPDVKLAYIRAERQKRVITTTAVIVIIASLVVLAFLISTVKFIQPKTINDLGNDITAATEQLQEVEDIDKILTVQNQLGTLTGLHDGKVVADRTFAYLYQLTPAAASVSGVKLDFTTGTIEVSGEAPDLVVVNKYADTLKFTSYKQDASVPDTDLPAAFSSVVLSAFSPSSQQNGESNIAFTITATFDPLIFSGQHDAMKLVVPNIVTTRGQVDRPAALFQPQTVTEEGTQ